MLNSRIPVPPTPESRGLSYGTPTGEYADSCRWWSSWLKMLFIPLFCL